MLQYAKWIFGFAGVCVGLLLIVGYVYQWRAERRDRQANLAPGQLIAVGDRRLHLLCKGSRLGPTIVIEQGAGEPARLWWPMQDRIADFAQVCTYDRAGYGWSDDVSGGRSIDDRVDDLNGLLRNAGVAGPFLFVAHSYGGLIVRRFAQRYPSEVGGLVLVDTPEEAVLFRPEVLSFYSRMGVMMRVAGVAARFGLLRALATRYPLDRFGLVFVRPGEYAATLDDLASLERVAPAMRLSGGFGSLGDKPLAVITHGIPFPGPFAILDQGWSEGQARLAAMSSRSELIVAQKSNHMIQHDEPELVLEAIRRVYVAMGKGVAAAVAR